MQHYDVPLIKNGKMPDEPLNSALGFWLPPRTPYGNFQLKYKKVIERLDEANRRIIDSMTFWKMFIGNSMSLPAIPPENCSERHEYANEQAIYMIRRASDELVALIWCLSVYEETEEFPKKIKKDRLSQAMGMKIFEPHTKFMSILNDISNAMKHSFVYSDNNLIGANEPRVHALDLHYNKQSSGIKFYDISLSTVVISFNAFYETCVSWLKSYSERQRPGSTAL